MREAFGSKLHKGLGRGIPNKCLPLDFMGYYALAGKEQDKRLKCVLKTYMQTDINKRKDYVKTLSLGTVERAMGKENEITIDDINKDTKIFQCVARGKSKSTPFPKI